MGTIVDSVSNPIVNRRSGDLLIGFKLVNVDLDNRLCDLVVMVGDSSGIKSGLLTGVSIGGLLRYKLINDVENYSVGKYYESSMRSSDWRSNPFQLVRYERDGVICHSLFCVNEAPTLFTDTVDPLGDRCVDVKYRWYKKSEYKRFRNRIKK